MITLTETNFSKEVLEYKGKVIIDVWANWCGKCKMFKPIFIEKSVMNPGYKFCTMDADVNPALCETLQIINLPTILIYNDGNLMAKGGIELLDTLMEDNQ